MHRRIMVAAASLIFAAFVLPARIAVSSAPAGEVTSYRTDRILVQPKAALTPEAIAHFLNGRHSRVLKVFPNLHHLQVLAVPPGETVESLVAQYQQSGLVEFAEPDYWFHAAALPDDPQFLDGTSWGLYNYGQDGGTPHADIDATNAWDILNSASNIVVAVLDSGIRATHEDLASNMWVNPIDGGNGFDAFTGTNKPADGSGHGTLMAGILGAVGNNGKGICGVAWRVQIMDCRCLDADGNGSASDVIPCMEYARTNGARIINASFSSTTPSLAVSNEIQLLRSAGMIIVAAAGNGNPGNDVDVYPTYPACYPMDNIISVAYTTRNDMLGSLSNYGATNVLLAAPGDQMYSTYYTGDSAYYPPLGLAVSISGTSFSAAYVSGACALLLAQYPADAYRDTIARLVNSLDPVPALGGKCRTGGRLNLARALHTIRLTPLPPSQSGTFQMSVAGGLNRTCAVQVSTNLADWFSVYTNTTAANGTFTFEDRLADSPQRFYRATASP